MRESLTILAALLILVLATALAGPYFVDWTAQRPWIEARLSTLLGRQVHITGPIDVKLLPSPQLALEDVFLTSLPDHPDFSAASIRLELSPMPLLRGELHFVDVQLDRPIFGVMLDKDGKLALPFAGAALGSEAKADHVGLIKAEILLEDKVTGRNWRLQEVDLEGEAASLAGPFKASGNFATTSGPATYRFSIGLMENERTRLRLAIDETALQPQVDLDGIWSVQADAEGVQQPLFEGNLTLAGRMPGASGLAWRMAGPGLANRSKAQFTQLDVRIGQDEGTFAASGTGEIALVQPYAATLNMVARQTDLDRLLASDPAIQESLARAEFGAGLPFELTLDASTPLVKLGGQTLPDAALRLKLGRGKPPALRLSMNAPGRSTLALDGTIEPGSAAVFKGDIQATTRQAERLADWVEGMNQPLAAMLRTMPFKRMELSGLAELSAFHFSGRDLAIGLDRSSLRGALAITRTVGSEPARLFADVASPALDLDEAPNLATALAAAGDLDLSITLDARAVKVARFGDGVVDAGHISGKLIKKGSSVGLENFAIENLGGASLFGTAAWDGARGHIEANLDAQRLIDLADLLRRIAPGAVAEALAARAVALSPAKIRLVADAVADHERQPSLNLLTASGTLGGTKINANIRNFPPDPRQKTVDIALEAPETWALLRQLGVEANVLAGVGKGSVNAKASGRLDGQMDAEVDATLAGSRILANGRLQVPQPAFAGRLKADGPNVSFLLRILGLALPEIGVALPMVVAGEFEANPNRLGFSKLAGTMAGVALDGTLQLDRIAAIAPARGDKARLSGGLKLDRMAFPTLSALALGPPQTALAGNAWAQARLGAALTGAPQTSLQLDIAAMDIAKGFSAQNTTLQLEISPGIIALKDMAMKLNGAAATGQLVLRRDGPVAAVSGKLAVEGLALRQPSLDGLANVTADFTTTGSSAAALVAGLAGAGKLTLANGRVPGADKGTINRVLALADKGQLSVEEGEMKRTMSRELDKSAFDLGNPAFDLTMAAGTLRLSGEGPMKLALDLRNMMLDQRLVLTETVLPKEWPGTLPRIEVIFKGNQAAPVRDVEASSFVNDIAAREIARDTAKIAALQADIRERAAFNRRTKALKQMRQNEIDLQNFLAAEAKRAAEEETRRVAEAQRLEREKKAAEDAARRAAAPGFGEPLPLNILPQTPVEPVPGGAL